MQIQIESRAPTRIDLAGGTLDLWPIHQLLDRKATVNVGVTLPAKVRLTSSSDKTFSLHSLDLGRSFRGGFAETCHNSELPLFGLLLAAIWKPEYPPLNIETHALSPAGAGLGGSSCLGIALAAALLHARFVLDGSPIPGEHDLVRLVRDVESRLIHAPAGVQDYWGGVRGRVNILRFPPGRVEVETKPASTVGGLEQELLLCYSGHQRASAINNWEIFKRLFDRDLALLAIFQEIGDLAEACAKAVEQGDLGELLRLSAAEWQLRTKLWPNIQTPATMRLDTAARQAGASFSRVCGAGGGGVMAVFAPPSHRAKVASALAAAGGQVLDAGVATEGLVVNRA